MANSIRNTRRETRKIIVLLQNNRQSLIELWVEKIRLEFAGAVSLSDEKFANHMIFIIDALIEELEEFEHTKERSRQESSGDMLYDEGAIDDSKKGGKKHGQQRANINSYNADKVYWEYVMLRKVLVDFLQKHHQLDIDHLEIITCVIERCTRESMSIFTKTLQSTQRKLLGTVVHDIRTPLNLISILADLAAEDHDVLYTSEFSTRLKSASGRISVMLEDMLQALSVESGQGIELTFQSINLLKLLVSTAEDAKNMYGNRLILDLPDEQVFATCDELMLKRVLENLISNAFKYGDKIAKIAISAQTQGNNVVLKVHNFGEPIAQAQWDNIFRFMKTDESRDKFSNKSWGIGLAFVKAVVEGHGGQITLSSNSEDGTTFSLEFPMDFCKEGESKIVPI